MKKVCVFTADGFEEIEGLTVVDLLRRAGIQVIMVSVSDTKTVIGSHNIMLQADALFEEVDYKEVDMLVLPGGMPGTLHLGEHEGLCSLIKEFAGEGKKGGGHLCSTQCFRRSGAFKGQKGSLLSRI